MSQLADRFVKDPHEVVKAGDVVRVRVTEVDVARKRIGLSMRKDGGARGAGEGGRDRAQPAPKAARQGKPGKGGRGGGKQSADQTGALGAALMDAMKKR